MKKYTLLLALLNVMLCFAQISQTEQDLMKKYWDYRDRYKKHFVKIGREYGESIPISLWYKNQNCGDIQGGQIKMGDAMGVHGDYLCLLATKYYYSISFNISAIVTPKFSAISFKYPTEIFTLPFSILFIFCLSLSHRFANSVWLIPSCSLLTLIALPNLIRKFFSGVTDIAAINI